MRNIFHFKEFKIDQSDCAMKVNTDGVLLAALIQSENPKKILDIGTGTGLIALMLAQRFSTATIDAVEIDQKAANRAEKNFSESPFSDRLKSFHSSIEDFFIRNSELYDLIVSNPPFFINSLKSENPLKEQARHTSNSFFENLLIQSANKLTPNGSIFLILPLETSIYIEKLVESMPNLYINEIIMVHSFDESIAHRKILKMGLNSKELNHDKFVIYQSQGIYTSAYQNLLKDFLTIF
jgi:tRNA1Val (adenine37-N6)-methyltransferase